MRVDYFGKWQQAAAHSDDTKLRALCGPQFENDFVPIDQLCKAAANHTPYGLLDFGCGLGRNYPGLRALCPATHITMYDCPAMLHRAAKHIAERSVVDHVTFETSYQTIMESYYDVVVASVVFQHLEITQLNAVLVKLKDVTKCLIVWGRNTMDSGENVWDNIGLAGWQATEGFFTGNTSDPTGHQCATFIPIA